MRYLISILFVLLFANPVLANDLPDADRDGIPDRDELGIYKTDPNSRDTDGDGYSDFVELNNGYTPLDKKPIRLDVADFDNDGLSDKLEFDFGTDVSKADSDGDGYLDGVEVSLGYNPRSVDRVKLVKHIEINTEIQRLSYYLDGIKIGQFVVSTGIESPTTRTPNGSFKIDYKHPRALSAKYNLWMPWWMSLQHGYFGIHELPEWSDGRKEGVDHLGTPASHGCIRLGEGPAEFLYNWAPMGTDVVIY